MANEKTASATQGAVAGGATAGLWGAVAGGLLGLGTSLLSGKSAKKAAAQANALTIWQQLQNQKWQEYMSNTAHQREVEDLKAAGLNPVLSANSGASAGSGGIGNVPQSASIDYGNAGKQAQEGFEKMLAVKSLANQISATEADIERKNIQNANETATTNAIVGETQAKKDVAELEAELLRTKMPSAKTIAEAEQAEAEARKGEATIQKENQNNSLWRFARGFNDITSQFLGPIGSMVNIAATGAKVNAINKYAERKQPIKTLEEKYDKNGNSLGFKVNHWER